MFLVPVEALFAKRNVSLVIVTVVPDTVPATITMVVPIGNAADEFAGIAIA